MPIGEILLGITIFSRTAAPSLPSRYSPANRSRGPERQDFAPIDRQYSDNTRVFIRPGPVQGGDGYGVGVLLPAGSDRLDGLGLVNRGSAVGERELSYFSIHRPAVRQRAFE